MNLRTHFLKRLLPPGSQLAQLENVRACLPNQRAAEDVPLLRRKQGNEGRSLHLDSGNRATAHHAPCDFSALVLGRGIGRQLPGQLRELFPRQDARDHLLRGLLVCDHDVTQGRPRRFKIVLLLHGKESRHVGLTDEDFALHLGVHHLPRQQAALGLAQLGTDARILGQLQGPRLAIKYLLHDVAVEKLQSLLVS